MDIGNLSYFHVMIMACSVTGLNNFKISLSTGVFNHSFGSTFNKIFIGNCYRSLVVGFTYRKMIAQSLGKIHFLWR